MNSNTPAYVYVAAVLVAVAIFGSYFYPKSTSQTVVDQVAGTSPTGATFGTAKIAQIAMAPQSSSATSTSILNTDSNDRIVLDAGVSCTGLGTAMVGVGGPVDAFHWYAATSSVAAPTTSIANALLAAMNVTVATSSLDGFTATSTYTSPFARRWAAGSYMIFQTNATSSAASCDPFVHYIGT